jgi:hypothetical protein
VSGESLTSFSAHLGADAWIRCHAYRDRMPILVVNAGGASVSVCARVVTRPDAGDVANARALVKAASTYLTEVERLHAETNPAAAGSSAAAA